MQPSINYLSRNLRQLGEIYANSSGVYLCHEMTITYTEKATEIQVIRSL